MVMVDAQDPDGCAASDHQLPVRVPLGFTEKQLAHAS